MSFKSSTKNWRNYTLWIFAIKLFIKCHDHTVPLFWVGSYKCYNVYLTFCCFFFTSFFSNWRLAFGCLLPMKFMYLDFFYNQKTLNVLGQGGMCSQTNKNTKEKTSLADTLTSSLVCEQKNKRNSGRFQEVERLRWKVSNQNQAPTKLMYLLTRKVVHNVSFLIIITRVATRFFFQLSNLLFFWSVHFL